MMDYFMIIGMITTLLIICLLILYLAFKKRKSMLTATATSHKSTNVRDSHESSNVRDRELEDYLKTRDIKVLSFESVLAATTSFSEENKLGEGGYGPVYKGILTTGEEVAIKRLSKTSKQGSVEFKSELTLICELRHINLIRLLGCCIHGEENILIYEYMANKSLDFYLFDSTRGRLLDWEKRFNIIEGISQGVLYLHKYSTPKIIHRDLMAGNILLDENFRPKISDFGLARLFAQDESTIDDTGNVVGTIGYMAPEYLLSGTYSTKSDVYSFGVLLLEIISGKRNNQIVEDDEDNSMILSGYLWQEDKCPQLMDPSLTDTYIPDEVQRCIRVGLLCVEDCADDRPNMSNVTSMLTNQNTNIPLPKSPAFYYDRRTNQERTPAYKFSKTSSSKDISTFSDVE